MSQHDLVLDNQSGAAFRADLNAALAAIVTQSAGAAAPSTAYANQMWYDTTNNKLMKRNAANSAWIEIGSESGGVFTFTGLAKSGTNSDITKMTALTSSSTDAHLNEFRLTLTAGTPVTAADVTGATTIYCSPHKGNKISLFDGTSWNIRSSAEFSLALGTLTSGKPYDVFCYDNAGVPTLEFLAWTNDTTRATALAYQDGVPVKSGAVTRRYLGTFYTTSTTATEDSEANRYLWNLYNQVDRAVFVRDTTSFWSYTTNTWRQANAAATNQINVVCGAAENSIDVHVSARADNTTGVTGAAVGIGASSTSSNFARVFNPGTIQAVANYGGELTAHFNGVPAAGRSYYAWLEISVASGTTRFFGASGASPSLYQSGMWGSWKS